jgi:mono/diheme cytochrome c family protein
LQNKDWIMTFTVRSATTFAAFLLFGAPLLQGGLKAQAPSENQRPALATSVAGRDSFDAYCAPCHGTRGSGDGPVAAALKSRPADLTALARRNNGTYPRERVLAFVTGTGRTLAAHGTTEMPIWGPTFRMFESDAVARQRMQNMVNYIESIQASTTAPGDLGSRLFRLHCATCHGTNGIGNGPLADSLRRQPPDLTTYTARNGGVFPSERLAQIIDGRHVPSHGDREMPVWGDAFGHSRDGLDVESAQARIDAIVRYLAGIQQRAG